MSSAFSFARRHKWKIAVAAVVGGTTYTIWRALRGVPVRQLVALMMKANSEGADKVTSVLQSGEGNRLLNACLREVRNDLAAMVDVQEKQTAAKQASSLQQRLAAFNELSISSLTRTFSAIYIVTIAQLLLHSQIFELVRLQKSTTLHEEAQRRFLSIVQRLSGRDSGPLVEVVRRVEHGVRRVLEKRQQDDLCDAAVVEALFCEIRDEVEGKALPGGAELREGQWWLAVLARALLLQSVAESQTEATTASTMGGEFGGVRLEAEVRGQVRQLSEDMVEAVESELFEEALAAALHAAFTHLSSHVVTKLFPPPASPPADDQPGEQEGGGRGAGEGLEEVCAPRVPLLKVVPVASNLFMSVMHPEHGGNPYTSLASRSAPCKALFDAVLTGPAPAGLQAPAGH